MEKLIPGFILKLWKMINDPKCDVLIWSDNGQSFIITDAPKFSQELSKYFKHNNLSSFIRQLNMYGFRKVATIENITGTEDLHFYHSNFIRDRPDLLEEIKRKIPQKLSDTADLKNVADGIMEIKNKHNDVSETLSGLKRENEMLWAELHDLRQKHLQQQAYITRLMKLVFEAMEQNGIKTNMLPIKRNSPLMIEGAEDISHSVKRLRTHIDQNALYDTATTTTTTTAPVVATILYDNPIEQLSEIQQPFELQQPDLQQDEQQELQQQDEQQELQQQDLQQELQQDYHQQLQQDLQQQLQQELQQDPQQELQQDIQQNLERELEQDLQPKLQQSNSNQEFKHQPVATTSAYELPTLTMTLDGDGNYQDLEQSINHGDHNLVQTLEATIDNLSEDILEYSDLFSRDI